jgi:hypothetical protein
MPRVFVIEDEFPLINNTGVSPTGCLIAPFYDKLTPDQVYSSSADITGDKLSLVVLIGNAEVALIPPNTGLEPKDFRYFLSKCQRTSNQM